MIFPEAPSPQKSWTRPSAPSACRLIVDVGQKLDAFCPLPEDLKVKRFWGCVSQKSKGAMNRTQRGCLGHRERMPIIQCVICVYMYIYYIHTFFSGLYPLHIPWINSF